MARGITLKDYPAENRLTIARATWAVVIIGLLLTLLIGRLVYLQVVLHEHYTTLSKENWVKLLPVPPTRGLIYDRNGVLLAENVPTYNLEITPEQVKDLKAVISGLRKLMPISDADVEAFRRLMAQKPRFESIPLRFHLTPREVARFAVDRWRFPGVEVTARLSRHYPLAPLAVHDIGYVGRIDVADLQRVSAGEYAGTSYIGKTGIERHYESILHGAVGLEQVEANAQGRTLRVLKRDAPHPGDNLYLTLDANLQATAQKAMGDYGGAVVALDPHNGDILAMVSTPVYNPNPFVNGISSKAYRVLHTNPGHPLFDRAIRGLYAPGSTIKPFMALAGLQYGVITPASTVYCPGYYQLPGDSRKYWGWKRGGHGIVDLRKAITQSCDIYFYTLAHELGIERMHAFLSRFGFGEPTGVDLPGEKNGLLPSPEWKRATRHQPWYPGETLINGIGQGFTLVTPLQLAAATATLATHGRRVVPHLLYATRDPATGRLSVVPPRHLPAILLSHPSYWKDVITSMTDVVGNIHGTAHAIDRGLRYTVAGKTGTAQLFGTGQGAYRDEATVPRRLRDNALFIGFAPAENPRIVVAVIVEHGGYGGVTAAPIARKVMDEYLLKEGR
ncbi:stage V sporulation protein D [bacterium BMS3Bbin12]|nr:stage V sporulation protein D [bacterium BMS3Abin12]GBE47932.1 stage V sporulation protein D [bacterium BMS3Bbin12]GBE49378.1 stage V sporulation protein D [bacterium BMS3Bbin13]HDJ85927.1 penicillin-binding protein 2 [Chromatiales bacterium]